MQLAVVGQFEHKAMAGCIYSAHHTIRCTCLLFRVEGGVASWTAACAFHDQTSEPLGRNPSPSNLDQQSSQVQHLPADTAVDETRT